MNLPDEQYGKEARAIKFNGLKSALSARILKDIEVSGWGESQNSRVFQLKGNFNQLLLKKILLAN